MDHVVDRGRAFVRGLRRLTRVVGVVGAAGIVTPLACGGSDDEPVASIEQASTGSCPVTITIPSQNEAVGQAIQISVTQSCANYTNAMIAYIDNTDCASSAYPFPNAGCHTDNGVQNFSTSTWVQVTPGKHTMVVNNWNAAGTPNVSNAVTFTYTAATGVSITAPQAGATVADPVAVQASASERVAINQMQVWDNGTKLGFYCNAGMNSGGGCNASSSNTMSLSQSYTLAGGSHQVTVEDLDNNFNVVNKAIVAYSVTAATGSVVLAGAGDIACGAGGSGSQGACEEAATANLVASFQPDLVFAAGDTQYPSGSLSDFEDTTDGWAGTWGKLNGVLRPAIGNHEYNNCSGGCTDNSVASGYVDYFNGQGVPIGQDSTDLYYSYDISIAGGLPWHVIVLDTGKCYGGSDAFWCGGFSGSCAVGGSNTGQGGDCTCPGPDSNNSRQNHWLCNDLATHKKTDFPGGTYGGIIAYYHIPTYDSASGGSNFEIDPIWNMLYNYKADIVLSGHSHHYERFNGMGHITGSNQGNPTCDARGPREFIVGTGGIGLNTAFGSILNCDAFHSTAYFGALKLTLRSQQYDFAFVDIGGVVRDAASGIGTL
jgi:hypothetical protein